jgi:hypothetical protein
MNSYIKWKKDLGQVNISPDPYKAYSRLTFTESVSLTEIKSKKAKKAFHVIYSIEYITGILKCKPDRRRQLTSGCSQAQIYLGFCMAKII